MVRLVLFILEKLLISFICPLKKNSKSFGFRQKQNEIRKLFENQLQIKIKNSKMKICRLCLCTDDNSSFKSFDAKVTSDLSFVCGISVSAHPSVDF